MKERITLELEGILDVYRVPDGMSYEEWYRLSLQEQQRYHAAHYENIITNGGYGALNSFFGASGTVPGWGTYLALGNGELNGVSANDTQLVNEIQRITANSQTPFVVTGNVVTIDYSLSYSSSNVTFTEAGLVSGGTSTANTGILTTHLLFPFVLPSYVNYDLKYSIIRY